MLPLSTGDDPMAILRAIKRVWFGWRDARDRRALTTHPVGRGAITWNPRHTVYVRAYYAYCVGLFADALAREGRRLHLVFGDYPAAPAGDMPLCRIGFQIEHTLVRPGGGDSEGAPPSRTPLPDGGGVYLARVSGLDRLLGCDTVVEYSAANLAHLRRARGFDAYLDKALLVSPLLYDADFSMAQRRREIVSLFSDPAEGRRGRLIRAARDAGVIIHNVKRCFDAQRLRRLYRDTRILVNMHRSDDHHTLEELRVLPALLCGVLVVSEDVPLRDSIPYARYVIWSSLDDLPAMVARVHAEYAVWHTRIFQDPELKAVLAQMQADNRAAVAGALSRWVGNHHDGAAVRKPS